jgi:hypothetical protein
MLKYGALFILLFFTVHASAQKHDYVWMLGYDGNDSIKHFGGTRIDFNFDPARLSFFNLPDSFEFETPCSIADENGNLEFYVDGCRMINSQHKMIENGYGFSPGWYQIQECNYRLFGYGGYQEFFALPRPEHPRHYLYFHHGLEEGFVKKTVFYSEVDMNANDGAGKVILKNRALWALDTIAFSASAVRHGNGRDWWVTYAVANRNIYRLFLVKPDTVEGPFIRSMEEKDAKPFKLGWNTNFSPDGKKFVRTTFTSPPSFFLYDFDRCAGRFSNARRIDFPVAVGEYPWATFSPNSRYLYLEVGVNQLYQYDLEATDIAASAILIGEYDGFKDEQGFPTLFHMMALTPEGKIYISCRNGSQYLHVIHAPDERGAACDFRQHDLEMPTNNLEFLPNYPNYRLGAMPDNACAPVQEGCFAIHIIPNPVSDFIRVEFDRPYTGPVWVYDMLGRLVLQASGNGQQRQEFDASGLPNGVYAVVLSCPERGAFEAGKCVVVK